MRLKLPRTVLRETLKMALDSVRSHKFRSFLTVLGIVIGVMTAIIIASILTGMRQNIVSIIEEYGTNNIYAFHLSTGLGHVFSPIYWARSGGWRLYHRPD